MWQNVSERREEISLLQAIGWKRWSIRRLILVEGMFSGLFAAMIGLTIAFLMMWGLYSAFPKEEIGFILATGLIPVVIGLIGTIFPAERAVRINPSEGMGGNISNQKAVEKRLKWVLISTSILLVGTFLVTMVKVTPKIERAHTGVEVESAFSPTEGGVEGKTDFNKPSLNTEHEKKEKVYETPGEYELEFASTETSQGKLALSYEAKEVESSFPTVEAGEKNIAIEFSFEVLDSMTHEMRPKQNFSLVVGEESYRPVEVKVLESDSWKDEHWLEGYRDGQMRAVLEFTVPDNVESYGLLLRNQTLGKGIMVWFE
nr:FtsX-like permease family protein [Sporosarcina jiandibaonis]